MTFKKLNPSAFRPARKLLAPTVEPGPQALVGYWMQQGTASFTRGEYEQALASFARAAELDPQHQQALNNQGGVLLQLRRYQQALECFARLLLINPQHVEALSNCGFAMLSAGLPNEALSCVDAALRLRPTDVGGLNNRGLVLRSLSRYQEALTCFDRALQAKPQYPEALNNRGLVLLSLERQNEALASFDHVLRVDADHLEALNNRGLALYQLGRHHEALISLDRALRIDPDHNEASRNRALVLQALAHRDEALAGSDQAPSSQPDSAETLNRRGLALQDLDRHREALACFDQALALEPRNVEALHSRAYTLHTLERHDEAIDSLNQALQIDPQHARCLSSLGFLLDRLNRRAQALPFLDRAVAADPGYADARLNRSMVRLALGQLAEGFPEFESRWDCGALIKARLATTAPLWQGQALRNGAVILLWHEQGFGDTIQFARYAHLVAALGAEVVLRAPKPLNRLLQNLQGVARLITPDDALPAHDYHCPLLSLPAAFGTTLASIPAEVPYLHADAAAAAEWRLHLGSGSRPRIGIAWAGRQYTPINWARDMPLSALRPLFELDAEFIALQKDIPEQDRATLDALPHGFARHREALADFADTAALISNLDLVITVDTAVAHLAAALGKPVWIMNRHAACWRWLEARTDSPWYPNARLFRQPAMGDWASVVAEVRDAAKAWISGGEDPHLFE